VCVRWFDQEEKGVKIYIPTSNQRPSQFDSTPKRTHYLQFHPQLTKISQPTTPTTHRSNNNNNDTQAVRDCLQYRGPPDPLKGEAPYQMVREAAKETLEAIYETVAPGVGGGLRGWVGERGEGRGGGCGWVGGEGGD
jgi:hypothetical protein